jgi:colanic acid/amylovoran biosynthesis protein
VNRRLASEVIGRAERVFVRDEASSRHLLDIGVRADRIGAHADFAFVLADAALPSGSGSGPTRVAVSVREWAHFRSRNLEDGLAAYRRAVAAAVRRLRLLGAEVEFVSTCQGVPEYWADDARFARRLVDELLPDLDGVRVDGRFRRPRELLEHLRRFDLAIATRMHFAVLALAAGVPVIPIAYEFKTTELFARLGLEALVEQIETIEEATLVPRVEGALAERAELRARVAAALPALRRDAGEPARSVAAFFRRKTPMAAEPASSGA